MDIIQRLLEAEELFFRENVNKPEFLLLTPITKNELMIQLNMEAGHSYEEAIEASLESDLHSYEGLTIAIVDKPGFPDFLLCSR